MSLLGELIERDGPLCVWCGREPWWRDLTIEHVLPRSRGGHTTAENLVLACRPCQGALLARILNPGAGARARGGRAA